MNCSHSPAKVSGSFQKILKKTAFLYLFLMQCVSVNFSANTAPIGTKLDTHSQRVPTMLVLQLNGSSQVYRELGLNVDSILEKRSLLTLFFYKSAKRVDTTNVTAASVGLTCCPTSHSTTTSSQLAVPFLCLLRNVQVPLQDSSLVLLVTIQQPALVTVEAAN